MDALTPSAELLRHLEQARPYLTERYLPSNYVEKLNCIASPEDVRSIDKDETHPLWWVLPPIAEDLFGDPGVITSQVDVTRSLALVPPPFTHLSGKLESDLVGLGLKVEPSEREFTGRLVAMLYGGHPWFEPYVRVCEKKKYLGRQCVVFKVTGDGDVIRELRCFKDDNRVRYALPVQMKFGDLSYPGLIKAFHTPSRYENRRHLLAAQVA